MNWICFVALGAFLMVPAGHASAEVRPEWVDQCLMSVTSTPNLRPQDEAHRKVRCYENTRGLADWCEQSVTATSRLDSDAERHYRGQCRRVSPS